MSGKILIPVFHRVEGEGGQRFIIWLSDHDFGTNLVLFTPAVTLKKLRPNTHSQWNPIPISLPTHQQLGRIR